MKSWGHRPTATANLTRDSQNSVKCPRGASHEALVRVVRRIKYGDEEVATCEKTKLKMNTNEPYQMMIGQTYDRVLALPNQ